MKTKHTQNQNGFTIIELLIATTIVSVILMLVSVMMINIGNLYSKGMNQSKIQQNARSVTDEVASHLQLTSHAPIKKNSPDGLTHSLCIGDTRYTYVIGVQIGTDTNQSDHVLWRDNIAAGNCPTPLAPGDPNHIPNNFINTNLGGGNQLFQGTNGVELMTANARLSALDVTGVSPYRIVVNAVYGDDDLLCSPSVVGSCETGAVMPTRADFMHGDLKCKGGDGQAYCAAANLTTSTVQRLR